MYKIPDCENVNIFECTLLLIYLNLYTTIKNSEGRKSKKNIFLRYFKIATWHYRTIKNKYRTIPLTHGKEVTRALFWGSNC